MTIFFAAKPNHHAARAGTTLGRRAVARRAGLAIFVALMGNACGGSSRPAATPGAAEVVVLPPPVQGESTEGAGAAPSDDRQRADAREDRGDVGVAVSSPFDGRDPVRVQRPPFAAAVLVPPPPNGLVVPPPRLVKTSETKNQITDEEAWFQRIGLKLPLLEVPNPFMHKVGNLPADLPARYHSAIAIRAIDHGDHVIVIYGANFSRGRYVAVFDAEHKLTALLDFEEFGTPPSFVPADAQFVQGGVFWAELRDGALYVSSGHHTYAKSSHGKNAFLTAVNPTTGHIYWQSAPLVANASNFLVRRGYIVSGYGFTAEPDFLFVIDRADGRTVSKIPVKSGPEVLLEKDNKLYVRTYNTDLVFDVR